MRTHVSRYKGNPLADCNTMVLPQNLVTLPGSVSEDFESAAEWTLASTPAGGTLTDDAVNYKTGAQSVKFTTPASAGNMSGTKTVNITCDGNIQLWIYAYDSTPPSDASIMMSNDSGFTQYFVMWYSTATSAAFKIRKAPGWNLINLRTSDWSVGAGAPSWANPMIRIRIKFHTAATAHSYSVDSLYTGREVRPACVFTFDDSLTSQYTEAYNYMRSRRVRGSIFSISSLIGAGGYLTWAQIAEMYTAGWTMGNHTDTTTNLTTLTEAQQEAALSTCDAALIAYGIISRQRHVAYPGGANNADTVTAMTNTGMLSGRIVEARNEQATVNDWLHVPGRGIGSATSLATAQGYIDTAKSRREVVILYTHVLSASPGASDWYIDRFQTLVNYCVAQGLPMLTIDDLYQLQSGPVRIPKAI